MKTHITSLDRDRAPGFVPVLRHGEDENAAAMRRPGLGAILDRAVAAVTGRRRTAVVTVFVDNVRV